MKFSIAALFSGVFLIVAPLMSYAYQLHVFEAMLANVLAANGRLDFPEPPLLWYCISCICGLLLIVLAYTLERQAMRLGARSATQAVAV
jgi:hypothetical protein